ncbi:MAG: hypothetical protein GXP45_05115 [bacterium]|nr:hypothetical protein [bacterium]
MGAEKSDDSPEETEDRKEQFKKSFDGIKGYEGDFRKGVSFVGRFSDSKYPGE